MGVGPHSVTGGTTDFSCTIYIANATTGAPETAVEHNTSGIDLWYRREGAAKTSITEAALTALTDAHSDGGIEHISNGTYRLDLPDAAVAAGVAGVQIGGTITGMVVYGPYIQIDPPVNVTKYGGTAGTFSGGRPEVNTTHAAGTAWGSGAITAAALAADASSEIVAAILTAFGGVTGAVEDEAGNSSTVFQTNLAETADDYYNGGSLVFTSGTNIGQVRKISDYTGSTGTVTVGTAFDAEPGTGDTFLIVGRIE